MDIYLLALLTGVIAGLRTVTAPTMISWAAYLGRLNLAGTWLSILGSIWSAVMRTGFALVEFVTDQLPATPSRTVPVQFGARLASAALCGAALGLAYDRLIGSILAGLIGAVIGTLGGRAARGKLASAFGRDMPAAFLEDALAIVGATLIGVCLP
jgi:uncharacterized membrane protein